MPVLSYLLHASILGWVKGSAMPTAPTSVKLGLLTAAPNPDGTGVTEPSGGYARQTVTFGSVTTSTGISSIKNTGALVFGPATGSDWAAVTYVGLFDGTTGDLFAYGPIPAQRVVPVADTLSFGINAVQLRLK